MPNVTHITFQSWLCDTHLFSHHNNYPKTPSSNYRDASITDTQNRFATICEQDGLHAKILVNYLITNRFQSEAHFW